MNEPLTTEQLTTGPWKVEKVPPGGKLSGDNWLVASFGEDYQGNKWYITTDHVHASEYIGEPGVDVAAIVEWRNKLWPTR